MDPFVKTVLFIIINIICVLIVSHVAVDNEFPQAQKVGAISVISVASLLFLIFGVIV